MAKKKAYLLLVALLLLGTTACGKETVSTEETTTQEQTEVTTEEVTTEAEAIESETTEEITEASTEEITTEATTAETVQPTGVITPEEAQELIVKALGTQDETTGNAYSFMHINTMTVEGVEYHVFMWGWIVDGHVSRLTDLFVRTDGSAVYEGIFLEGATAVYTEENYLE